MASAPHPHVLRTHRAGATTWLTLSRPDSLNAFDFELQQALRDEIDRVAADDSVRCVVLTGSGRAFCAGADLDIAEVTPEQRLAPRTEEELRMRYNPIIKTIRTMGKPVIAAVNGPAIGVGCALAMACDHVIAAETASFSLAFAKVGLTLDAGSSALLGARIGFGRVNRMALLAEQVDAATASSWGMVDAVVAPGDLTRSVTERAERFAAGPTLAFAATKRTLNAALLPHLDAVFESEVSGQTSLVDSADFREGAAAFAARRRPEFTGSQGGPGRT